MDAEITPIKNSKKERLDRLYNDFWVIDNAPDGITKRHLEELAKQLELTKRSMAALLRISERTLSRYNLEHILKEPVSEHALQVKIVVKTGQEVFGDQARFLRWLKQPCDALGRKVPFDLLGSITGARIVRDELVRIDYGVPH